MPRLQMKVEEDQNESIKHTRSTAKIFAQIKTRYGRRSSLVACNKRRT